MEPEKTEIQTGTDDSEKSTPAAAGSERTSAGSVRSLTLELLLRVGGTVLALWLVLTFIAGLYVNHGNEGYPMVKDGDLCVTYRLAGLRPGDAVMYVAPDGRRQCGRVAALAGDRVEISGIPYGMGYEVTEVPENYDPSASVEGDTDATVTDVKVTDPTLSENAAVTFTNTREGVVPSGVVSSAVLPALVCLTGIVGAGAVLAARRRRHGGITG